MRRERGTTWLFVIGVTFGLVACGDPSAPPDGASDRDVGATSDARDGAPPPPDGAAPDAPAMDAPATDAPATDAPSMDAAPPPPDAPAMDAPAMDRVAPPDSALAPCTLPNGSRCPRGTTCPAGDGCNVCACPASGGAPMCTLRACPPDAGGSDGANPDGSSGGVCTSPAQCTLFSSYCATMPCVCLALGPGEPPPRCVGPMVTCFVDPCRAHTADCAGGRCVVR